MAIVQVTDDREEQAQGRQAEALQQPATLVRIATDRSFAAAASISREGGAYNAGVITGAAVVTYGEAKGHGMWIDKEMLQQVADAINSEPEGVKSRFTHPGLSGDGLGKALGRFRDARIKAGVVRADLHFFESAHDTPDGDLADYVMRLAAEDPAAFGTSIAFDPDIGAEDKFRAEHTDDKGIFHSPDKKNTGNLLHVRLAELEAVDFVDSPAANPDGLFHRGDQIAFDADRMLRYAFELSDEVPPVAFGVHPDRVRGFVQRWLDDNGFELMARMDIEQDADEDAWAERVGDAKRRAREILEDR